MTRKPLWSTAPSQDKTVVERVSSMIQPETLKTDEYDSHNGGTGNDIWAMISAAGTGDTRCLKRLLKRNSELVRWESNPQRWRKRYAVIQFGYAPRFA